MTLKGVYEPEDVARVSVLLGGLTTSLIREETLDASGDLSPGCLCLSSGYVVWLMMMNYEILILLDCLLCKV